MLVISLRPIHTRGFAPGACFRGTLREQSSSVYTNDFMGVLSSSGAELTTLKMLHDI